MQAQNQPYNKISFFNEEDKSNILEIRLPFLFGKKFMIGVSNFKKEHKIKSKLFFITIEDKPAQNFGDSSTKKMFALQFIKDEKNKLKIGFMQRRQTIKKIGTYGQ